MLGEDVTLQCQSLKDELITVLKWVRPDLKSDGYVFFYRNKRSFRNYQHPSFLDRVQLMDPEMKDGNVSVILNNVTLNDTGTYECHVSVRNTGHTKRITPEITHFINLKVSDSGHTHESKSQSSIRENTSGNMQYVKNVKVSNDSDFGGVNFVVFAFVVVVSAALI